MKKSPCWMVLAVVCALGVGPWTQVAAAAPPEQPSEDPLALAALLVSDGRLEQARAVLSGVDTADAALDRRRYWSLVGLVALQQQDHAAADDAFGLSMEAARAVCVAEGGSDCEGAVDPLLRLSQARARLLGGDAPGALRSLSAGGGTLDDWPGSFLVKARAHEENGDAPAAWAALAAGHRAHPEHEAFPRQQVLMLVRMGLYREAGQRAQDMVRGGQSSLADTVATAEALRKAGALDRAAVVLEEARLRWPEATEATVRLAAVHADAGRPMAAARLLQHASISEPQWALVAAELYREAGRSEQALYLNAQVLDAREKVKQRFGLLLDSQDFERAVALDGRLHRLGLVQDEESIRYGLAYAWFRVGEGDRADALLGGIADPQLYRDALALRGAIERCRSEPGACQ